MTINHSALEYKFIEISDIIVKINTGLPKGVKFEYLNNTNKLIDAKDIKLILIKILISRICVFTEIIDKSIKEVASKTIIPAVAPIPPYRGISIRLVTICANAGIVLVSNRYFSLLIEIKL